MAVNDKTIQTPKPLEPQTLDFIERISYFEHLGPIEADNDNATYVSDRKKARSGKDSDCFNSWALPDFANQ